MTNKELLKILKIIIISKFTIFLIPFYGILMMELLNLNYTLLNYSYGIIIGIGAIILMNVILLYNIKYFIDRFVWYIIAREEEGLSRKDSFIFMIQTNNAISDNRLIRREIQQLKCMEPNKKLSNDDINYILKNSCANLYPDLLRFS